MDRLRLGYSAEVGTPYGLELGIRGWWILSISTQQEATAQHWDVASL